jgi:hypothetical protein
MNLYESLTINSRQSFYGTLKNPQK